MAELVPGTVFDDRYRLDQRLARGGMAEVFVAEDLRLQRRVAVKVLMAGGIGHLESVTRFRREALAAAGLSHPNIVAVFDAGEAEGMYFIVMEYVAGRTLADLIASDAPLSAAVTAGIGAQVAAALDFAHSRGVIHRDIKPANVLLAGDGRVKLTDFGIARVTAPDGDPTLTSPGMVIGTPAYLSPEQVEGRPLDGRTDIYSLGAVLYEMATGSPPFRGDTAIATAFHHVRTAPVPAVERNPALPERLNATIMRALAKDPALRQPDAATMRAELAAVSADPTPAATAIMPTGPDRPAAVAPTVIETRPPEQPPGPRRAGRIGLVLLLAAAVAALAIFGLVAALAPGHHRSGSSTTAPPVTTTTAPAATTTSSTVAPTTLPVTFTGYQVVAGSGASSLFCPSGVSLGQSGQTTPGGPSGPAGASSGQNGGGGAAGCGSDGGAGGKGGHGAPGGAGGAGGDGGAGGCPPATLAQMQSGTRPCDGTGSNGGSGGDGGNAAPLTAGGRGGSGGPGGQTTNAKGGDGANGGDAKPGVPGAAGGNGGAGGGPTGTASGVNGSKGTPAQNA